MKSEDIEKTDRVMTPDELVLAQYVEQEVAVRKDIADYERAGLAVADETRERLKFATQQRKIVEYLIKIADMNEREEAALRIQAGEIPAEVLAGDDSFIAPGPTTLQ